MAHFQIRHRWIDAVLFEGQFDTMRLCVEAAVRDGARLVGARLDGARLDGARLDGASLVGASLVGARLDGASLVGARLVGARLDGAVIRGDITLSRAPLRRATRTDGYEFFLLDTSVGWRVLAGCRFVSMEEARAHWRATRAGTPLGDETFDILGMFDAAIARETASVEAA